MLCQLFASYKNAATCTCNPIVVELLNSAKFQEKHCIDFIQCARSRYGKHAPLAGMWKLVTCLSDILHVVGLNSHHHIRCRLPLCRIEDLFMRYMTS
jgi:hypothetical protein